MIVDISSDTLSCLYSLLYPANLSNIHQHKINTMCITWSPKNMWLLLHQDFSNDLILWFIIYNYLHDVLLAYLIYHILHQTKDVLGIIHMDKASTDLWKNVFKSQYDKKLMMLHLVRPIQPSHIIVNPYLNNFLLYDAIYFCNSSLLLSRSSP